MGDKNNFFLFRAKNSLKNSSSFNGFEVNLRVSQNFLSHVIIIIIIMATLLKKKKSFEWRGKGVHNDDRNDNDNNNNNNVLA